MSKGYRGIILATIGWLILAASTEQPATNRNEAYADKASAEVLQNIAIAIQQANKSPEPDAGCEAGQDARNSDLCAQWKAADAAKESADWTRRTFWLGCLGAFIGIATFCAAGYAAWYAKQAADETRRTANAADDALRLTERVSQAELKPLISVDIVPKRTGYQDGIVLIDAEVEFTNLGGTEATNVNVFYDLLHHSQDYRADIAAFFEGKSTKERAYGLTIFPNETMRRYHQFFRPEQDVGFFDMGEGVMATAVVFVVGAYYQSTVAAKDQWLAVERAYRLSYKGGVGIVFSLLKRDDMNFGTDALVVERLR